jgi:RNA polymerase sigma factor for flagellar operon FliA
MTLTAMPQASRDGGTATPASDDRRQVEELIRSHLPLVNHLVRDVLGRVPSHVRRDELVSAGMLALVTSAKGFDSSRGVVFARFAAIRIRGALTDELRSMDWASRTVRGKARELDNVVGQLASTDGRVPTQREIAAAMGLSVTEVDAISADVRRASMLSLQVLQEGGVDLDGDPGDNPESILLRREQIGHLRDAIAELPDRLRLVIEGYFYNQRTMVDIAQELGVTESRVSQLRSEALGLMRGAMHPSGDGDAGASAAGSGTGQGREAVRQAYCAAVATRSTLASRLAATSVLGQTLAATSVGPAPLAAAN